MTNYVRFLRHHTTNHKGEIRMKKLFVLMSHEMTPIQKENARRNWGVDEFVVVPSRWWGQIPADADSVCPYTKEIKSWLDTHANKGDMLLVQGDFGATVDMIAYARKRGLVPVYATTKREAQEKIEGDNVVTTRVFVHVRFREYEDTGCHDHDIDEEARQ